MVRIKEVKVDLERVMAFAKRGYETFVLSEAFLLENARLLSYVDGPSGSVNTVRVPINALASDGYEDTDPRIRKFLQLFLNKMNELIAENGKAKIFIYSDGRFSIEKKQ
jgi:hypothetical protein